MTSSIKILVVDDSAEIRLLIKLLLQDDYTVLEAGSGESCLVIAENDKPDLILLDVDMPGLNGYQVCQKLRKESCTKDIPIIFVSGLDSQEERLAGFEAGADEYIFKPVEPLKLLVCVVSLLNKQTERKSINLATNQAMQKVLKAMTLDSELGQIDEFEKTGKTLNTQQTIGDSVLKVARDFKLDAAIMLKATPPIFIGCDIDSTEASFLIKAKKNPQKIFMQGIRFVLCESEIVMLIKKMPAEEQDKVDRLKDHLSVLMNIANGYLIKANAQIDY